MYACRMDGTELRERRRTLGLTQSELAAALTVSTNTIARWERDEMGMPGMIDLALKALESKPAKGGKKAAQGGRKQKAKP